MSANSRNVIQVCQNDYTPFPLKADLEVVPQPGMEKSFASAFDFLVSKAGAYSSVKSAVLTFAGDNPAGTLLPLVCVHVFKSVQS